MSAIDYLEMLESAEYEELLSKLYDDDITESEMKRLTELNSKPIVNQDDSSLMDEFSFKRRDFL
ncbi:hypothetical protein KM038_05200 [Bacillus velezensis]|uniref:hypothetical protein n=1 Tax=Bacillus velezensis TaxID=492670 RepID=UPI001C008D89|nr:hypothetical protein [Bacillus velezensis]MBT9284698.1 hypothetical protein [Bacillus velezensis]